MTTNAELGDIAYRITQNDCVGYSQPDRLTIYELSGPDDTSLMVNVDCSEMVCAVFTWAGSPIFTRDMWTGSLLYQAQRSGRCDDWAWTDDYEPAEGDILLADGHVGMIGHGLLCEAWIAEDGSIDGYRGDSGGEVRATDYWSHPFTTGYRWYRVIRFHGDDTYGDDIDMSENTEYLKAIYELFRSGKEGSHFAGDMNWYARASWQELCAIREAVKHAETQNARIIEILEKK